jgi:hypothetical protein
MFFVYLFENNDKALEFLQEAGLLRSVMPCPQCGQNMTRGTDRPFLNFVGGARTVAGLIAAR